MSTINDSDLFVVQRSSKPYKVSAPDVATYVSSKGGGGGGDDEFPAGTKMVFYQSSAPTGWTKEVGIDDHGLKVVASGGGVTGGTQAFSNCFKSWTHSVSISTGSTGSSTPSGMSLSGGSVSGSVGNHNLSSGQTGAHSHNYNGVRNDGYGAERGGGANGKDYLCEGTTNYSSGTAGRGEGHSHSFSGSLSGGSVSGGSHSHSGGSGSGSASQDLRIKYAEVIVCTKAS